jgi:hypothetical protein
MRTRRLIVLGLVSVLALAGCHLMVGDPIERVEQVGGSGGGSGGPGAPDGSAD